MCKIARSQQPLQLGELTGPSPLQSPSQTLSLLAETTERDPKQFMQEKRDDIPTKCVLKPDIE